MGDNLGVLEEVTDLRSIWPREAHDFTPWLASNIGHLGNCKEGRESFRCQI